MLEAFHFIENSNSLIKSTIVKGLIHILDLSPFYLLLKVSLIIVNDM